MYNKTYKRCLALVLKIYILLLILYQALSLQGYNVKQFQHQITHKNCLAVASCVNYAGIEVYPHDTVISYLPLAHSFEKVLFTLCVVKGVRIGFSFL